MYWWSYVPEPKGNTQRSPRLDWSFGQILMKDMEGNHHGGVPTLETSLFHLLSEEQSTPRGSLPPSAPQTIFLSEKCVQKSSSMKSLSKHTHTLTLIHTHSHSHTHTHTFTLTLTHTRPISSLIVKYWKLFYQDQEPDKDVSITTSFQHYTGGPWQGNKARIKVKKIVKEEIKLLIFRWYNGTQRKSKKYTNY